MSSGVGLVVATHRPGNPIGWLLMANGLVLAGAGFAESYASYALVEDRGSLPGADWAVLYDQNAWPLLFAPFTAIAFVFPDGRLPSPRWRPVAGLAIGSLAVMLALGPFSPGTFDAPYEHVSSPLPALPTLLYEIPAALAALAMVASLIAAAVAVRTRLRRSVGIERRQILLLAYAATLVPVTLVACWVQALITGGFEVATVVGLLLMAVLIPLAIGSP